MKITVEYNGSHYYWVDTITMHDEYDYACAILVSSTGNAFPICIDKITVVDDIYNFEKEKQKRIDKLKCEQTRLEIQTQLNAAIERSVKRVALVK